MLRDVGFIGPKQTCGEFGGLMRVFMNVWADNADAISVQYSGTPALKYLYCFKLYQRTDYTRTGKRSSVGAMTDLKNSCIRYFKNNYMDGKRQVHTIVNA